MRHQSIITFYQGGLDSELIFIFNLKNHINLVYARHRNNLMQNLYDP